MKSFRPICLFGISIAFNLCADAQQPNALRHTVFCPSTHLQSGARQGQSIAIDGNLVAVGSPYDDVGGENSGVVKVYDRATGALLHLLKNPRAADGDSFGFSVALSGTRLAVGSPFDNTGADNSGRAYVFELAGATPTIPTATLNNPSPAIDDSFGYSVSISGTRLVVGAYLDDNGASNAGRVYVYSLGGTATLTNTLNNPTPAVNDLFGISVGISGTRVVVGAIHNVVSGTGSGSAYVYDLAGASPSVPITLNNPTSAVDDDFGASVAVSGTRVVVGDPKDDTALADAGSAYVYDVTSATPTMPIFTLNNPAPGGDDEFGNSVAISGTRVIVGAATDDTGAMEGGSAYVYDLAGATPTVPVTTLNNPTGHVLFGDSVAISGTWLAIGAPFADFGAPDAGSAYVYDLTSATPTEAVAVLNTPSPASSEVFGRSVAISGSWLVVGAIGEGTGGPESGSAYIYDLASTTPTVPAVILNNPHLTAGDWFGHSVAISGTRVAVGAPYDDTAGNNVGRAYVYDLASATPAIPVAILNKPNPVSSDWFGFSVAISGTRVAVSSYADNTGATDAGTVYVYDLASLTPTIPAVTINNPTPASGDFFGYRIAMNGAHIVIGAYSDNAGATDAGSAYAYDLASAMPTVPVLTLNNPSPESFDSFGQAVAINGTRIVVAADNDNTGGNDAGSVYVYDLASATPTMPVVTLNNPSPAVDDGFGRSVSVSGSLVVVSKTGSGATGSIPGTVYVYDVASATPAVPTTTLNNPTPDLDDGFGFSVGIDGLTVVCGTPFDDEIAYNKGVAYIYGSANRDLDGDGLFDLWEYARFGTIAGHGPTDDADSDGICELLELALNLDPLVPDAKGQPLAVNDGGYLSLALNKRAGVTYTIESAGTPDSAAFSAATTTILVNNPTLLKARDNFPIAAPGQRLMHLKVIASP